MVIKSHLRNHVYCSLIVTLALTTSSATARDTANTCKSNLDHYEVLPLFTGKNSNDTHISANQTKILGDGISRFIGDVVIEQNQLRIKSDNADYDRLSEDITLTGNIHADSSNISLDASTGFLSIKQNDSMFTSVQFHIPDNTLRGEADTMESMDENHSHLSNALITSCSRTDLDWSLKAKTIDIDHLEEYGSAEDAVIDFYGIPFIYLPYIEFPVGNKRRSGLLVPEIGNSDSRGVELSLPWYWNIAPNHDAIITLRHMQDRGTGLETNYRYLTDSSTGELDIAHLNDDAKTNQARHYLQYKQDTDLDKNTSLNIDINDVSDTDYNNDFNNMFEDSNQTYLDREISVNYDSDYWQASILAHTAETLNGSLAKSKRPYRRLPQITANAELPLIPSGLSAFLNTEAVRFEHEDKTILSNKITGSRLMITPGIDYSLTGAAWHFHPSLELSHTQYDTEDRTGTPVITDDRTLPIASLDAGLYFERTTDNNLLQTLEPRVFYLNVPYEDQSGLPLFDTSIYDFSFDQLFRNNRFNGNDLIGDTNHISLAISSNLLDPETGKELISASIGQIFYLNDRNVTLPGGTAETTDTSDIVTEFKSTINHWTLQASAQWDIDKKRTEKENFSINYVSNQHNIFNLSYRMRANPTTNLANIKHIDTSIITPLSDNFNLIAKWDYSLKDERDIAVLGGISYDSCCWSMTLLSQRYLLTDKNQEYDSAIMLQLIFKELGSVSGNRVKNTLKHSIPGYTEDY